MTRFARAKGSKASNEKAPEDSTPWEVMKEQLLQAKKENEEIKKIQQAENQRIENYENFLKEQKVKKKNSTWCDFPETVREQSVDQPTKKKKKHNQNNGGGKEISTENQINPINNMTNTVAPKKSKVKNKNPQDAIQEKPLSDEISMQTEYSEISKTKTKKKREQPAALKAATTENISDNSLPQGTQNNSIGNKTNKKKKNNKFLDDKPVRRKPIDNRSFQIIIHGKEIELVRVDGFPVMKKDAEHLTELKNNMIKKGIPKSEIQRTMKLERRRAEKSLARVKREVCYNCRKGGHNLSDCPDLKSKIPDAAEGICFKCGSTEHRQFECKVQRDKEFRFATCFICKEPGHIARQCPDNPKGLYPNGGGCKVCGDVTHLRKDCPTAIDQKEKSTIKLNTFDNELNTEDMPQSTNIETKQEKSKKPKKIRF